MPRQKFRENLTDHPHRQGENLVESGHYTQDGTPIMGCRECMRRTVRRVKLKQTGYDYYKWRCQQHPKTPENTVILGVKRQRRTCRSCYEAKHPTARQRS